MTSSSRPVRIKKLLVANRGEIARRVMATARQMNIATAVVFSDADADALFVQEADEAIRLPGSAPSDTYLRADLVIEAARKVGADAVHPGYGFLSENAGFVEACAAAGLCFVGPSAEAVRVMGSKLESKRRVEQAGVPLLPSADLTGLDALEASRLCEAIGWPLLLKASAGGGGRGMRIVRDAAELASELPTAVAEATSAFGDGAVFAERYLTSSRHVEVQVFGDTQGTVVALFERECSVQRRHQKIIEECPSPAVDEHLREQLSKAAVGAAQSVDYVGAGTVEFMLTPQGEFYFLEMNTRLQVEHPVTEAVTGLDLVRLQLLVAMGHPLPAEARNPVLNGHAIEARLYAEDATQDYRPATGTLTRFDVPATDGIRIDTGVAAGSEVGVHYDPMLAKVIAWAPDRDAAAEQLASVLRRSRIHGVTTNRDLLVGILTHDEFVAGQTDTGFLERNPPGALSAGSDGIETLHLAAAALALSSVNRRAARVLADLPSGWRNNPSAPQAVVLESDVPHRVEYRLVAGELAHLSVDGSPVEDVSLVSCSPVEVCLEAGGVRRLYEVDLRRDDLRGDDVHVDSPLGASRFTAAPRLPDPSTAVAAGSLTAPMPGTVVAVRVAVGDTAEAGQALVVIESMKMQHQVVAAAASTVVEIRVELGTQVQTGEVLVVLDSGDPSDE